jgi:hypothetical protein
MGAISPSDFNIYYVTLVIKIVWFWWKDRYINQWNKIENLEIDATQKCPNDF